MPHADPIAHGAARDDRLQCLPVLRAVLPRVSGDGEPPDLRGSRSRVSRQPVPQLRRVSLRLPVRAAARVRHQRAEDAGGDSRAFVRGVLLAVVPVERLQASQPADRPRSRRRTDRGDVRGRPDRERRRVPPAGRPRRLLRRRSARRDGRRSSELCSCSSLRRSGSACVRFWRDVRGGHAAPAEPRPTSAARSRDALTLRHLHGSGVDCTSAEEQRALRGGAGSTTARSTASCCVLRRRRWRPFITSCSDGRRRMRYGSLPVLLGMAGGAGLLVGPAGLLDVARAERPGARRSRSARPGRVVHRAVVPHQPDRIPAAGASRAAQS